MNAYVTTLSRRFAAHPDAVALQEGAQTWSGAALETASARYAAWLLALRLKPGDRVLVQIDTSSVPLLIYLGALRAGLVFVPLPEAYGSEEMTGFVADAQPGVFVCRSQQANALAGQAAVAGLPVFTLDEDGSGTLPDALHCTSASLADRPGADDDLALLLYTAGSTGRPRGAMRTHANVVATAAALADHWHISENDALVPALSSGKHHCLYAALHAAWMAGARVMLHGMDFAVLQQATLLLGTPDVYARMLDKPSLAREACGRLRLCLSTQEPLPRALLDAFFSRTGLVIRECYSMSESGVVACAPNEDGPGKPAKSGTVGKTLPGQKLRILGANLKPMPFEHPGNILIQGPATFKGWWRRPEETAEAFTSDGWFKTGDVGMWDENGYISLLGHVEDCIHTGVYKVYPAPIEAALRTIPGVADAAVIAVAHAEFVEAALAIVEPSGEASGLTEAGVLAELQSQLAHYQLPLRVQFETQLPRNTLGKVQRGALRAAYGKGLL